MLEFEPQRTYAITNVTCLDGEIFVTGVSNQRFKSTLHRIPYSCYVRFGAPKVSS